MAKDIKPVKWHNNLNRHDNEYKISLTKFANNKIASFTQTRITI